MLKEIEATIPALPEELVTKYMEKYNLSRYDADVITDDRETAAYFESLVQLTSFYKAAANWLLGPVKSHLNENGISISDFPVKPATMAALISLVEDGGVHFTTASSKIFPELIADAGRDPLEIATSMNLIQTDDETQILAWVKQAMDKMPDKVLEYKKGKKGLLGLFVGEVKKISNGKADPQLTNQLLIKILEK
jgi:aspartyl-tRNA(Asn)/glutamyl-tRNA(Gln) amidotransferase subunit B